MRWNLDSIQIVACYGGRERASRRTMWWSLLFTKVIWLTRISGLGLTAKFRRFYLRTECCTLRCYVFSGPAALKILLAAPALLFLLCYKRTVVASCKLCRHATARAAAHRRHWLFIRREKVAERRTGTVHILSKTGEVVGVLIRVIGSPGQIQYSCRMFIVVWCLMFYAKTFAKMFYKMGRARSQSELCYGVSAQHDVILTWRESKKHCDWLQWHWLMNVWQQARYL